MKKEKVIIQLTKEQKELFYTFGNISESLNREATATTTTYFFPYAIKVEGSTKRGLDGFVELQDINELLEINLEK